jgi:para-nitrobenzyl esterase
MRILILATALSLTCGTPVALAAPTPADAPAAAAKAKFTTTTSQLSTLMADPAAKAVLVKHIPALVEKDDILDRAGGMTLRDLQDVLKTYAPDLLSDAVLAKIDADLALIK